MDIEKGLEKGPEDNKTEEMDIQHAAAEGSRGGKSAPAPACEKVYLTQLKSHYIKELEKELQGPGLNDPLRRWNNTLENEADIEVFKRLFSAFRFPGLGENVAAEDEQKIGTMHLRNVLYLRRKVLKHRTILRAGSGSLLEQPTVVSKGKYSIRQKAGDLPVDLGKTFGPCESVRHNP